MFEDLLAQPGVEEICELRSRFGLMAIHGGNLERGTDVIAAAAAERAGVALYVVRQPPGLRWHVPSVAFDPSASPALARFLDHVDVAVAVHGYGRPDMWTTLLVGGQNRPLAATLRSALEARWATASRWSTTSSASPSPCEASIPATPSTCPGVPVSSSSCPHGCGPAPAPTFRPGYEAAITAALVEVASAHEAASRDAGPPPAQ